MATVFYSRHVIMRGVYNSAKSTKKIKLQNVNVADTRFYSQRKFHRRES